MVRHNRRWLSQAFANAAMGPAHLATVFVLISAELGEENEVLNDLRAMESVKEAYRV